MVIALDSRSSVLDSSPADQGHCVVFLGKTLNSHSASLHAGTQKVMDTGTFGAGGLAYNPEWNIFRVRNTPSHFMLQKA